MGIVCQGLAPFVILLAVSSLVLVAASHYCQVGHRSHRFHIQGFPLLASLS